MVAVGIVDITASQCPLCGGDEARITVRTAEGVLRRCLQCGDEQSVSGQPAAIVVTV